MQNIILKKKGFITISISILILIGISSGAQSLLIKQQTISLKTTLNTQYNGTLSGFVRDPSNNSIEGALVRVYFHETYRENYSDSNGYYHVTDIPLCYCLKNATCSKEGYKTEWVLLSISENTTYDFTLYPLGSCYPVFNGIIGCNGWYVSPVEVSFMYNPEEVWKIYCSYVGQYTEPFTINDQGAIVFEWYWIDYGGNTSDVFSTRLKIDYTIPDLFVQKTKIGYNKWEISVDVSDSVSGVNRIEFYLNSVLYETIIGSGPTYSLTVHSPAIVKIKVYDMACNANEESIILSKTVSYFTQNNPILLSFFKKLFYI